jgi:hypothetical protein
VRGVRWGDVGLLGGPPWRDPPEPPCYCSARATCGWCREEEEAWAELERLEQAGLEHLGLEADPGGPSLGREPAPLVEQGRQMTSSASGPIVGPRGRRIAAPMTRSVFRHLTKSVTSSGKTTHAFGGRSIGSLQPSAVTRSPSLWTRTTMGFVVPSA